MYVDNWHVAAVCEHLEAVTRGDLRQLLINVPPRSMKSLLTCVFWPAWVWTHRPEMKWLFSSYSSTLSTRDSVRCRRLIRSPWYQERWGDRYRLQDDQDTKTRYENDRSGFRYSTSFASGTTGDGGNIRVVDDPHAAGDVHSEAVLNSQLEWFKETWSSRYVDANTDRDVIIMQRLHERDLSGFVLAEDLGYEHLMLPAEFEPKRRSRTRLRSKRHPDGWADPRTQEGELLDPARMGPEALAKLKKSLGSYGTAGQLQQRPSPAEGGLIKRWWWRFWCPPELAGRLPPVAVPRPDEEPLLVHPTPLPESFDRLAQSWDMSFKALKTSDRVSGLTVGCKGPKRFVLDRIGKRLDFADTVRAVITLSERWPLAVEKLIESAANGPAVVSALQNALTGLRLVTTAEIGGSKEARVHASVPQIEAGDVYLPHPAVAPWTQDFIEQCAAFPNGAFDDDVDALTLALVILLSGTVDLSDIDLSGIDLSQSNTWGI